MTASAPRIFVSAGEPSGDQHAAPVVTALLRRFPGARIEAFGGPAMAAAGASVRFRMEPFTAMGFLEVITKLRPHLRLLAALSREFRAGRHDLVVLVDYPGFNLRLAQAAREAGIPTLYYIAPQLWAWRPGRARRLGRYAQRVAVILPFEPAFFRSLGVPATFVGHPLAERDWPTRADARSELGIGDTQRVLAVFPGSRTQEVERLWPDFREAASRLLEQGACDHVLVAGTAAGHYPGPDRFTVMNGESTRVLAAADAAIVKSGTTTLEAAMCGTPLVVAYRVHPLSAVIARRVMRVPWVSLVNLVAGRLVVPELLQDLATPDRLVQAVRPLLDPHSPERLAQVEGLQEVRGRLGSGGAADRVAALAAELLPA
ncbi:MAG TPA: lipid-A-disaccharide synthase [Gemmatimonadales bacterium]